MKRRLAVRTVSLLVTRQSVSAKTWLPSHELSPPPRSSAQSDRPETSSAPSGTPIYSVTSGTVTQTGYDGAYGNKTVITLEDGTELWYCHQTSINVSSGESVSPGQQIGTVGSTGNTTGPHLHLEVHPGAGDAVDPVSALSVHGVVL